MDGRTGGLVAVAVVDMAVVSVHIVVDKPVQVDMDCSPAGAEAVVDENDVAFANYFADHSHSLHTEKTDQQEASIVELVAEANMAGLVGLGVDRVEEAVEGRAVVGVEDN